MKTDHQYFIAYDRELVGSYSNTYYVLDMIRNAVSNEIIEMIDVESCTLIVEEVMKFIALKKRFILLKKKTSDKLLLTKEGFKIGDSTFTSLDEIEKALKNKAFL